mgnify:CR=1 FL=1
MANYSKLSMLQTAAARKKSFKVDRLSIAFGAILVLIIVTTAIASIWSDRKGEIAKWMRQAEVTSVLLAENTSYQMSAAHLALDSVVERIQDRGIIDADFLRTKLATQEFHQFLKEKLATSPHIDVLSLIDEKGNMINTTRSFPAPVVNLSERDYFLIQKNNPAMGVFTSASVRNKITGKWAFYLTRRLTGSDGEFIGVVILGISPDFLTQFYEKISDPHFTSISLLKDDFTILARWPEQDQLMGKKNLTGTTYSIVHNQHKKSGVMISDLERLSNGGKHELRMAAVQVLDHYPLIINFTIDESLFLNEWRATNRVTVSIAVGSILAVIAAFSSLTIFLKRREEDLKMTTKLKLQAEVSNQHLAQLLDNLTQHKNELQDSSDRLQAVFNNAADGIIMLDEYGKIEAFNPAAVNIYGYAEKEMIGHNGKEFVAPGKLDALGLAMSHDEFIQTGRIHLEDERMHKDGTLFPAEFSISKFTLSGKLKLVVILRDITERRRMERIKSEFISTVSHELRTPLTAIRGALGLINGGALGALPEKMMPMISIAYKNSENLTRLINDLLDIEKFEAGKIDFIFELLPVDMLLASAVASNQGFAHQFGVHIVLDNGCADTAISVDEGRFQQVMANLLSNACKYAPKGSTVRVIAMPLARNKLRIEVIDLGSGIPENFRDRIFQKFSQADSSDTRAKGGTGLGLAITKAIVKRMHGEIAYYHDDAGEGGTHFYVDFPVFTTTVSSDQTKIV